MVVQGTNVAHLLELQALAMSLSLPTYLVQDAGLTQVKEFFILYLNICGGASRHSKHCYIIRSNSCNSMKMCKAEL